MWTQVTGDDEKTMIAIINTLLFIISIAWFIIIASAIFSWLYAFNVINTNNQVIASIGRALYNLTEPVYRPIRRFLPDFGGVDLSPLVLILAVQVLLTLLQSLFPGLLTLTA